MRDAAPGFFFQRLLDQAAAAPTVEAAGAALARELVAASGLPIALLELYDAERQVMRCLGAAGLSQPAPVEGAASATLAGLVARTGQPLLETCVAGRGEVASSSLGPLGIEVFVGVPMSLRGRVLGVVSLASRGPEAAATPELVTWLEPVGAFVGSLLEHKRTETALRHAERRLLGAQRAGRLGTWEWQPLTGELIWAEATYTVLGLDPTEPPSLERFVGLIDAVDRPRVEAAIRQSVDTASPYDVEFWITTPGGLQRRLHSVAALELDGRGVVVRMTGVIQDVTEARRVEESLRDANGRLEATLAALPDLLFRLDGEGRIRDYRAPDPRRLHLPPPAFLGRRPVEILPEPAASIVDAALAEAARTGHARGAEYFLDTAEGRSWYELSVSAGGAAGTPLGGYIALIRDVTERRRAQATRERAELRLRENAQLLEQAQRLARLGTYVLDLRTGVWSSSAMLDEVFGIGPAFPRDVDGWGTLVHPDDRAEMLAYFEALVRTRGRFDREYRIVRPCDGEVRWVWGVGELELDGEGAPVRMLGAIQDVSARQRDQEEKLELLRRERAARAEAERASRSKDLFLSTASHELRTPLTSILAWTQLIRSGRLDAEQVQRGLGVVEQAARTQARLVDDLLDISRIAAGKLAIQLGAVSVSNVLGAVLATLDGSARQKQLRITLDLDPHAPEVCADPGRLQQVLVNVIGNAIKFTPTGGTIAIALRRRGEVVQLSVTDSGVGIEPGLLPRVFDQFFQADGATTRQHGGLGLGLAISQHLMQAMGGSIEATSPGLGQGTTITVTVQPRPGASAGVAVENGEGAPEPPAVDALRGLAIVLVDDDEATLEGLAALLARHGAQVSTARSAREALAAVGARVPDLLVSDISMPEEDGYSLLRRLRALPPAEGGGIAALALTALAGPDDRAEVLAAGFQGHLAKPVDEGDLVRAISRLTPSAGSRAP